MAQNGSVVSMSADKFNYGILTEEEEQEQAFIHREEIFSPAGSLGSIAPFTFGRIPSSAVLILLTLIMIMIYFDRGLFASSLNDIEKNFSLNGFKKGLIGSLFMVGYMISSPIFSQLARDYRPLRILWAGLAVWSISVFSTGISTSFWWACLSRTTTGIGEAAFLCVSPTVINQCAPKKYKSSWIAIFYASIPFGYAIGNICGGIRINSSLFSPQKSWGIIFCLEALAMLPLILSVMVLKGPNTLEDLDTEKLFDPRIKDESTFMSLLKSVFSLCKNRLYVLTTLGYAAQTFTFGGFAYYGIDYSQTALKLNKETASNVFGAVTLFTGIIGTGVGGIILDRLRFTQNSRQDVDIVDALKIMFLFSFPAIPFAVFCFVFLSAPSFFVFAALTQFCLFACLAPTNSVILWSVPVHLQPLAVSFCALVIHALGDAISPVLIGAMLDFTHGNWRFSGIAFSSVLIISSVLWFIAWQFQRRKLRRY